MGFGLFLDIFVALVVLASVGIAFMRGFVREVLTIFGIVGGIVAAYIGRPLLSPLMRQWLGVVEGEEDPEKLFDLIPYPMLADILAYGAILIVFVIILSIISHVLAEIVKNIGLGALDRTLGVVFGLARAVLVLGVLYLFPYFILTQEQKDEYFEGSHSSVYLEGVSGWLASYLPQNEDEGEKDSGSTEDAVSEARKKFEELGVLGDEEAREEALQGAGEAIDGYSKDLRNKMDELIEEQMDSPATEDADGNQ